MVRISFSWDDGAEQDLKLMDLSLRYNIPSIFFIPATNKERPTLSKNGIKTLVVNGFEIGAHTYSHSYLTHIRNIDAGKDIKEGKDFLEQLLGTEVFHFCFPGGKYNLKLIKLSEKNFRSARTADTGAIISNNSFLIKPAFHFYNRGKRSLIYNSLKNISPIFPIALKNLRYSDYFDFIRVIIDDLSEADTDYSINIWGHSWEIEEFRLWTKLEEFFRHINNYHSKSISGYSDIIHIH